MYRTLVVCLCLYDGLELHHNLLLCRHYPYCCSAAEVISQTTVLFLGSVNRQQLSSFTKIQSGTATDRPQEMTLNDLRWLNIINYTAPEHQGSSTVTDRSQEMILDDLRWWNIINYTALEHQGLISNERPVCHCYLAGNIVSKFINFH